MKTKEYKGITLIALIITIIVLLILAAVSISIVVGDNGVLGQAVNATVATDVTETKEAIELAVIGYLDSNGNYTIADVEKAVADAGATLGSDGVTVTTAKGNTFDISDLVAGATPAVTWTYTTNDDGELAVTNGTTVVTVGDIIYYTAESGKTYTSYSTVNGYKDQVFNSDSYTYGWRVLGADEDTGELLITTLDLIGPDSGGYTTSLAGRTYFYMAYQEGYNNCEDELDAICSIYGTGYGATGGRSITVEDVNKLTGYDPTDIDGEGTPFGSGYVYQYGNEVTYYWDNDGDYYPSYKSDVASGESTLSHGDSSFTYGPGFVYFDVVTNTWKSSTDYTTEQDIVTLTSDRYYYTGSSYLTTTDTLYELLFYNNSDGASNSYAGKTNYFKYWLGSPYVCCDSADAQWGCRGVINGGVYAWYFVSSNGSAIFTYGAVRCVVSLDSGVSLSGSSDAGWAIN